MNYWPSEQTIVNEYQVITIPWDELLTKWTNNSYWISSNDNIMRWIIDQVSIVITWYSVTIVCSLGQ
jgi:hypothetical protein